MDREPSGPPVLTLDDIVRFVGGHMLGVVATLGRDLEPEAALVGIAASDRGELVFDTVDSTGKVGNIRRDPRVALVVGGSLDDERTLQCRGIADEPTGVERDRIKHCYFTRFPDGRDRQGWEGITYVRVRLTWLRYSDFNVSPPVLFEAVLDESGRLLVRQGR